MSAELTALWHVALAESVDHDMWCSACVMDRAGWMHRCAEGARIYRIEQAAWQEMKAAQYLGVA